MGMVLMKRVIRLSKFIDDVIKLIDPEIDFSKHYDGLIVFR